MLKPEPVAHSFLFRTYTTTEVNMYQLQSFSLCALFVLSAIFAGNWDPSSQVVAADQCGAPAKQPASADVLEGKLKLLAEHLDEAIAGLQAGNLKQFVSSYVQLVRTFRGTGDEMQSACRHSGRAAARIGLSRDVLRGLDGPHEWQSLDRDRLEQLSAGVQSLRDELLLELRKLRTKFGDASQPDEVEPLLEKMRLAVERIEQLDQFLAAKGDAAKPTFAFADLDEPLQVLEAELGREEKLLEVQAAATAELMNNVSQHVDKALQYLELESEFPYAELEALKRTRRGLQAVFTDLQQMRRATSAAVTEAVKRRPDAEAAASSRQVLDQANVLLDRP